MLLMLLAVAIAIAGITYAKVIKVKKAIAMGKSFAPPPAAVTTVTVQPRPWTPLLRAVGSVKALQGVTVTTDLAGIVSEICFESGQAVRKGTLLLRLQSDQETAQLHGAQARKRLAELELARKLELRAKSALPASEIDLAENELQQATSAVEQASALLARKNITAPFDGMMGLRQVSLGQLLNPGTPIATMHSMDPVRVQFPLPQQQLALVKPGLALRLSAQGIGSGTWSGTITALDSQLSETARSITVEATLPNPGGSLRQGMFVHVEIPLPEEPNSLVLPASAINYAPYGDTIYVLFDGKDPQGNPQRQVESRAVKVGEAQGDLVRILSGLKAGEEVVSSGVFKLRPMAPVRVNNSLPPPAEAAPTPPNE
ncbi:MAG: hypothetical protein RLZZ244_2433 [Verrucomicrobiota bacterium]|jgi:membrane fusion protein (multidrug efflux system)